MDDYYDETPIINQEWQVKYGLRKEYIELNETQNLSTEQQVRLDILHNGTEEQIKQLSEERKG